MKTSQHVDTPEQAILNESYRKPLVELLYQLADDDMLAGFRASEWLGLAPHIEADVAFSSIAQNTVGHAAMLYQLLEQLGERRADDLVHLRSASEFRNATLMEQANGTGSYLREPRFDWAFAVARYYVYEQAKAVKFTSLSSSSFRPLATLAVKIKREQHYHLIHWQIWVEQLAASTEEARQRLRDAFARVWADVYELFSLGAQEEEIVAKGLIESPAVLRERWLEHVREQIAGHHLVSSWELFRGMTLNGRNGEHTQDLSEAIHTLSEVYRRDPAASW